MGYGLVSESTSFLKMAKDAKYACELCSFKSSSANGYHLKDHIKRIHQKVKKYLCQQCGSGFLYASKLKKHEEYVHQGLRPEKKVKCSMCSLCFESQSKLRLHIKAVHERLKDKCCQLCEFSTSANGLLAKHIRLVHLNEKLFPCDECHYFGAAEQDLYDHKKRVHRKEKDIICIKCSRLFSTRQGLVLHVKRKHVVRAPKFACDVCEIKLISKTGLKMHIAAQHLDAKNHKCMQCN